MPSRLIRPVAPASLSIGSRPAIDRSSCVFPTPDGPVMKSVSPFLTVKESDSKSNFLPTRLDKPETTKTGFGVVWGVEASDVWCSISGPDSPARQWTGREAAPSIRENIRGIYNMAG